MNKNEVNTIDFTKMKEFDLEEILNNSRRKRKKNSTYGALDNNSKFLLLCSRISARFVYMCLCKHADSTHQTCFPSLSRIGYNNNCNLC